MHRVCGVPGAAAPDAVEEEIMTEPRRGRNLSPPTPRARDGRTTHEPQDCLENAIEQARDVSRARSLRAEFADQEGPTGRDCDGYRPTAKPRTVEWLQRTSITFDWLSAASTCGVGQ